MATFELTETVRVVRTEEVLVFSTNDPMKAESRAQELRARGRDVSIAGTHPTHQFVMRDGNSRCENCDTWDNGCWASHMPRGQPGEGAIIDQLEACRAQSRTPSR